MPPSPIDTLASVAAVQAENNHYGISEYSERPSKRARSEALASPLATGTPYSPSTARPSTSHNLATWGRNVDQQIDAAMAMGSMRHSVPQAVEQLSAAETLLSLFHSNERSLEPSDHATDNYRGFNNGIKTAPLASTNWATSSPYVPAEPLQPEAHHFGINGSKYSRANGLDGTGQTHTPPDDSLIPNGLDHLPRRSLNEYKEIHMSNGDPLPVGNSDMKPLKQLQSPQSLPAEVDDPRVREHMEDNLKTEDISSQGLGISVNMGMPPPDLDHAPSSSQNQGFEDSQVTIPALEEPQASLVDEETKCARCGFFANSITGETVDWMQCEGCQQWFHFGCTGFTAKEIRKIDKFFCQECKTIHGSTTFVRKSARNRTNVDYSSLNEGHYSTVDESQEHRYIQHFREGTMKYVMPESFPRLAPEDITIEHIERLPSLSEPIVIPARLNPRPKNIPNAVFLEEDGAPFSVPEELVQGSEDEDAAEEAFEVVDDDGQDGLGMVIPHGLSVRRVAELYGSHMPVPVIDVKSQEGDSKKWTVGEWADYYEKAGDKPVRNVISLEVSHSPLGKLLRRPKIVRDLDLQDAVWPETDRNRKAVKFYVLMSVADCYTDFHIDFGGSSVYYHILKGRKVFFFIPPTEQNLKKYEDWCLSPAQNDTFLPDLTKECYRVDLYPGDTMLIPSGWIHSVWTPEDSLVIGGNYLTRLHIGMQIKITEIEKNTKVAPIFRYPSFQKVQWYTLINYLEQDPVPTVMEHELLSGKIFTRLQPLWVDSERFSENAAPGAENYHSRYYAKSESEGWPALLQFIFRTVLIHLDRLEGVTQDTRKKVNASIPKGYGEPVDIARKFAVWVAWKRGNEPVVEWALPNADLPSRLAEKKHHHLKREPIIAEQNSPPALPEQKSKPERKSSNAGGEPRTSHRLGPKKVVCDSCREKKIACKHVDPMILAELASSSSASNSNTNPSSGVPAVPRNETNGAASTVPVSGATSASAAVSTPKPKEKDSSGNGKASLSADGKRRWGKACVDCRRSKVCLLSLSHKN
jgi:F-box and leucine-rich repeat protein 10/11